MSDLTAQRDRWNNFGFVYGRTGTTRGTTTSSGVITVDTGFPRTVVYALATDEATHTRVTQTGGGPAYTMGTFLLFQPISNDGRTARFRVWNQIAESIESGATYRGFTVATTTTAITFKWLAFGY